MATIRTIFGGNEPLEREGWALVARRLIGALAPSAQPFRGPGKGFPSRGGGPRLTDRKHYK